MKKLVTIFLVLIIIGIGFALWYVSNPKSFKASLLSAKETTQSLIEELPWEKAKKQAEEKEREDFLFSKRKECQEVGQRYYQQPNDSYSNMEKFLDKYTYNEELNTCLISYGMHNSNQTARIFFVVDTLSGKELLQYRVWILGDNKLNLAFGAGTGSYLMTCDDSGVMFKTKCSDGLRTAIKAAYDKKKVELMGQ